MIEKHLENLVQLLERKERDPSGAEKHLERHSTQLDDISSQIRELNERDKKANAEAFKREQEKEAEARRQQELIDAVKGIKSGDEKKPEEKKGGLLGALLGLLGIFGSGGSFTKIIKTIGTIFGKGTFAKKLGDLRKLFPKFFKTIDTFGDLFKAVGKKFTTVGKWFGRIFGADGFIGKILKFAKGLGPLGKIAGKLVKFLGPIGAAIGAIMAAFEGIKAFVETDGNFLDKFKAATLAVLDSLFGWIPDLIKSGLEYFGVDVDKLMDNLKGLLEPIIDKVKMIGGFIIDFYAGIWNFFKDGIIEIAKKLPFGIGDKITGWLESDDEKSVESAKEVPAEVKEKKEAEKKKKVTAVKETTTLGKTDVLREQQTAKMEEAAKASGQDFTQLEAAKQKKSIEPLKEENKRNLSKISSEIDSMKNKKMEMPQSAANQQNNIAISNTTINSRPIETVNQMAASFGKSFQTAE